MAFDSLSSRLQMGLRRLTGKGKLDEKDIDDMLREVRLSLLEADVNYKVVKKFLAEGDKVKVSIRMRGRQQARPERGIAVCQQFAELVKKYGTVEKAPSVMDRNIIMFIAPIAKK